VQQDLEEGFIKVFGMAQEGYFRYCIHQKESGLFLKFEKIPKEGLTLTSSDSQTKLAQPAEILLSEKRQENMGRPFERLSLGQHKSQDWSGVKKRHDLTEIFPHWLRLGQVVPEVKKEDTLCGTLKLLQKCRQLAKSRDKVELADSFINLFLAGFSGIMVPRIKDEEHQGFVEEESNLTASSALALLTEGSSLIRSLFFEEKDGIYHLLPCLPSEFHCGRLLGIVTSEGDIIDLEWTKKLLRRVIIRVNKDKEMTLSLQKDLKRFRLKKSLASKGVILTADSKIHCAKGDVLYLDNFQK
jgi:hypothetical protein